jgi:hypothetical protein
MSGIPLRKTGRFHGWVRWYHGEFSDILAAPEFLLHVLQDRVRRDIEAPFCKPGYILSYLIFV